MYRFHNAIGPMKKNLSSVVSTDIMSSRYMHMYKYVLFAECDTLSSNSSLTRYRGNEISKYNNVRTR